MRSKLSEFLPRIMLVVAIGLAAGACGGDEEEEMATVRGPVTATSAAPSFRLDTPVPRANETVPVETETAARKFLGGELEVDERKLKLDSSEGVGWSDASLGCPKEGMFYAQVITPGYKLVFDFEGTSYAVHTNSDGSRMLVCGGEQ